MQLVVPASRAYTWAMVQRKSETALGVARARFIRGLGKTDGETKRLVRWYIDAPADVQTRDALRGHLHTLHASAQVFELHDVAAALKQGLRRLDQTQTDVRDPQTDAALFSLCDELRRLAKVPFSAPSAVSFPGIDPQPVTRPVATPSSAPVANVLVFADNEVLGTIRAALPSDRYEIVDAHTLSQATELLRKAAPDIVFVDREYGLSGQEGLLSVLKKQTPGEPPPVVCICHAAEPMSPSDVEALGVADALPRPLRADAVMTTVAKLLVTGGQSKPLGHLGKLTLDQLVERLADELKQGLISSANQGRWEKVAFGEGSEVLASTWSAIARIRSAIVEESKGKIAFRDTQGPPVFSIAQTPEPKGDDPQGHVSLVGRKALVADDDPAVVWFFSGLLAEAGVEVVEAENGLVALSEARRFRPDVILSDILMPKMDGLALCKAVQRDPALAEVPVILLSWKEDFLERMRELKAGASGYLRKEARSQQILSHVREVLSPHIRLQKELKEDGEVRGRTDGVGVLKLLSIVASVRPNASVTVRDAWNMIEVELRNSAIVEVIRTASDGTFARDEKALAQLIGVTAARFSVVTSTAPTRHAKVDLEGRLGHAVKMLGATIDSLAGEELMRVASIGFDAEAIQVFANNSPSRVREVVRRLAEGKPPRQMVVEGGDRHADGGIGAHRFGKARGHPIGYR